MSDYSSFGRLTILVIASTAVLAIALAVMVGYLIGYMLN